VTHETIKEIHIPIEENKRSESSEDPKILFQFHPKKKYKKGVLLSLS
jgi:hypothetical protein